MAISLSVLKKKPRETGEDSASKRVSNKQIKPRAPRSTTGKKVLRTVFWIVAFLIVVQGCVATIRGPRVIQQINNYGVTNNKIIDESVKGFATDFALEYFTWNVENMSDHSKRLNKFINTLDGNAGINLGETKGSSRVLSAEVYNVESINDNLTEVTVLVRREFTPAPTKPEIPTKLETSKVYMVVPVSQSDNGFTIQSYPRFVGEQLKGDSVKNEDLKSVSDEAKIKMAKDLAEGFLRAWYDGNINQLKYFYLKPESVPSRIAASSFTLDKVETVQVYKDPQNNEGAIKLNVQVTVRNATSESFKNVWNLTALEKDAKMYVVSLDDEEAKSVSDLSPAAEVNNKDTNQSDAPAPASVKTEQ